MRARVCVLMITLLFLAGCGGQKIDQAEQLALDVRSQYLSMAGCTATLEITADYGDRVFECVLVLDHTAGGATVLTVAEPEILRGVTARMENGTGLLEFDGVMVDTGPVVPEGYSPIDCVPFLLEEVRGGFISRWGLETVGERECVRFTTADPSVRPGAGTECEFWFDRETLALLKGEVSVDGSMVLRCETEDFTWKEKEG